MTVTVREVGTDVWVLHGSAASFPVSRAHPDDLEAAEALTQWRAREFLAGRTALRLLLGEVRSDLADLPIRVEESGRPALAGHSGTGISISHDGGAIAVAVAPGRRVGVDVQTPPASVSDGLLRRCLHEWAPWVAAQPADCRARELAWVWTVQEACVKAIGTGLAGLPWSIDVPPGRSRGRWGAYAWVSLRDRSRSPLSCAFTAQRPHDDLEGSRT